MAADHPSAYKTKPHRRRYITLLLAALLVLAAASATVWYLNNRAPVKVTQAHTSAAAANPLVKVEANYLYSGTIVLARDVEKYAAGNYNQPFSGMASLGNYDAHIGILECPITNNYDSYQNEIQNLVFNCKPAWVPYLKKYFTVLNLSSDHLNDQGPQGIAETFQTLKSAGIQTVGTYNPATLSDDCKAVVLPVRTIKQNGQAESSSLPIAMCSYNYKELFHPEPGQLESIKKWAKLMPVVALLNEGPEYQHTASPQTVAIAHQMINYGADYVVGNGTHWVQNTEVYKGKLIVYSMGNFIFDQIDYYGRIALNLSVSMTIPYNQNLQRWIKLSGNCLSKPEGCLSLAQKEKLAKLHPSYKFNVVGSYGGDALVAKKADPQQQADIEKIADWQTTMEQLANN